MCELHLFCGQKLVFEYKNVLPSAGMGHPLDPPPWFLNMAWYGLPPGYSYSSVDAAAATEEGPTPTDDFDEIHVSGVGLNVKGFAPMFALFVS